jgi:hypothetical protein
LNKGEKWHVIPVMMVHIRASETLFSEYTESESTDFIKLAEGLKENNNKLIKSCTMKGKAHDELHKWLHPHLQLVEALGKALSIEQASKITDQLKLSFQTLNTYFK